MFQVSSLAVLLGLMLYIFPSHGAQAEDISESGVVYEAARNKIGLIRYCRRLELLDPATADQAIKIVENGLHRFPPEDLIAITQGDRAERAGEDGFWDAGRNRDIAGVAKLFRTTQADLCQEWAAETVRSQRRRREIVTIPVAAPIRQLPKAVEQEEDKWPSLASEPAGDTAFALPPLPERAPFQPSEAAFAAWQRAAPPAETPSPPPPVDLGQPEAVTAREAAAARLAAEEAAVEAEERAAQVEEPLASERPITAAAPARPLYGDAPAQLDRRAPTARRGPSERCLMPGCRWPTAQERDYWR
jgi:hypothetical protein